MSFVVRQIVEVLRLFVMVGASVVVAAIFQAPIDMRSPHDVCAMPTKNALAGCGDLEYR